MSDKEFQLESVDKLSTGDIEETLGIDANNLEEEEKDDS